MLVSRGNPSLKIDLLIFSVLKKRRKLEITRRMEIKDYRNSEETDRKTDRRQTDRKRDRSTSGQIYSVVDRVTG